MQWTIDGIAICTATRSQSYPQLVSDGSGGAIFTWYDTRSGINHDIYAQRIKHENVPVDEEDDDDANDDDDSAPEQVAIPGFNLMIISMILVISVISVVKMLNRKNRIIRR